MGIDTSQVDGFFYTEMAPVIHTYQGTMELQINPIGDYLASASRVYTTSEVIARQHLPNTYSTYTILNEIIFSNPPDADNGQSSHLLPYP